MNERTGLFPGALRNIIGVILLIILIGSITGSILIGKGLITPAWILWTCAIFIGIATSLPLKSFWRWLTGSSKTAIGIILNLVIVSPLMFFLILLINGEKNSSVTMTKATVTRVYSKTRHHSRRVSRNTYVQGAPYKVYFADINLSDMNQSKSIDLSYKRYRSLSKGDTVTVPVNRGALGITYIDNSGIQFPQYKKKKPLGESLRERRHRSYNEHINKILKRSNDPE